MYKTAVARGKFCSVPSLFLFFLLVNISMKGHVIYGHAIGLLTKNCARELRVLQDETVSCSPSARNIDL